MAMYMYLVYDNSYTWREINPEAVRLKQAL